jgi:DNA invertase Pin-like site-specific DNA recombinase
MTAEINTDPWTTLDGLWGVEAVSMLDDGIGPLAFSGRCSTEDNQDPETSRAWQFGNAHKFVEPLGGDIVEEFFDVGQSRSVPWERRPEAARLLDALKDPNRGWSGVVVGEGTRCWFGNQFSLIAPRFEAYGVDLWVPELGGKFDPRNPSHKMLMSVLGGMSESERQHVQARVRAAMDAQVVNEGRHQGGRAPYGYVVVDGGPHPNPQRATGCACSPLTTRRPRRCGGSLPTISVATSVTGRSRLGSTATACRVRQRCGRNRIGTGSPTAGREARSGRFWKIPVTRDMRSLVGGGSSRHCSTRTTWPPVTS